MQTIKQSKFKVSPRGLMIGHESGCRRFIDPEKRFAVLRQLACRAGKSFESFSATSGINLGSVRPFSLVHDDARTFFKRRFSSLILNDPYWTTPVAETCRSHGVTITEFDTPRWWHVSVSDVWLDLSAYWMANLKYQFNRVHDRATVIQDVKLNFGVGRFETRPPSVTVVYGYKRDGSSWGKTIATQRPGETTGQMLMRVKRIMPRIADPLSSKQRSRNRMYLKLLRLFDGRNVNSRSLDESEARFAAFETNDWDKADYHPYFWSYRIVNALSHIFVSDREIAVPDSQLKSVFVSLRNAINSGRRVARAKAVRKADSK